MKKIALASSWQGDRVFSASAQVLGLPVGGRGKVLDKFVWDTMQAKMKFLVGGSGSRVPKLLRRLFLKSEGTFGNAQAVGQPVDVPAFLLPPLKRVGSPDHYLTATAIVKNEADYLDEWLAFHRLVGVEHFYIYDNGSDDGTLDRLAIYVNLGLVTLLPWPPFLGEKTQRGAYAHALLAFGQASRWMLFIDADEFVFPGYGNSLSEVLSSYEDLSGLLLPWHCFGHCGHKLRPRGLVIEHYRQRSVIPNPCISSEFAPVLTRTKMIVDPRRVLNVSSAHEFLCDAVPLTVRRQRFNASEWCPSDLDPIVINHYRTKSEEEFARKLRRTLLSTGKTRPREDLDKQISVRDAMEAASVDDPRIQRFVSELKKALGISIVAVAE